MGTSLVKISSRCPSSVCCAFVNCNGPLFPLLSLSLVLHSFLSFRSSAFVLFFLVSYTARLAPLVGMLWRFSRRGPFFVYFCIASSSCVDALRRLETDSYTYTLAKLLG